MSKYLPLWEYIANKNSFPLELDFDTIRSILGFQIDHSFLSYKNETEKYNFVVKKISLKEKTVKFDKS